MITDYQGRLIMVTDDWLFRYSDNWNTQMQRLWSLIFYFWLSEISQSDVAVLHWITIIYSIETVLFNCICSLQLTEPTSRLWQ